MTTDDKVCVTLRPDGTVEIEDALSKAGAGRVRDYLFGHGGAKGMSEGRQASVPAWLTAPRLRTL